jgi:hypothetical protein
VEKVIIKGMRKNGSHFLRNSLVVKYTVKTTECIIQYKPIKCTFSKLIFQILLCLLYVSNPMVHLQEDGCTYRYGTLCFTCNGVGRLVGGGVCSSS